MQAEASGQVGALFHLMRARGCHAWLDVREADLTEQGMRSGVRASDVFVFFLTTSVLSRPFCVMEFECALALRKPVLLLRETEERYAPWSYERWRANQAWDPAARAWAVPPDPAERPYDRLGASEGLRAIRDLIDAHGAAGRILPYRRRDYEADAMVSEILRRANAAGCAWGAPPSAPPPPAGVPDKASRFRVTPFYARESTGPIVETLGAALRACCAELQWSEPAGMPPHTDNDAGTVFLVALGRGVLAEGSESLAWLRRAIDTPGASRCIFVFAESAGWVFYGDEQRAADPAVQSALANNEALAYREPDGDRDYEHAVLVAELARRIRLSRRRRAELWR